MGLSICYLLSAICYFGARSSTPIGYWRSAIGYSFEPPYRSRR